MSRIKALAIVCYLILGAASFAHGQSCPYGESPSANCYDPRVIPGSVGRHVVLMDVHGTSGTYTLCDGISVGNMVYFEVTPEVTGWMTISTCHPHTLYDTVLEVASGVEFCERGTVVACNDDYPDDEHCFVECSDSRRASQVNFYAYAGTRYVIRVGSYNGNPAGCPLCLGLIVSIGTTCGDPPYNFICSEALELDGTFGSHDVQIDLRDMPSFPEDWSCSLNVGDLVWFKFIADIDGFATFTTCRDNTEYDTVVRALQGECSGMMFTVACNDDCTDSGCSNNCGDNRGSKVEFAVDAGEEYLVEVGAYNDNVDNCDLCLGARLTVVECETDSQCDDGNPCTEDTCGAGTCELHPSPSGTPCGDPSNTACTDPDTCNGAGQCLANHASYGTPCTDDGNQCTYDQCDGAGSCTHPYKPPGTSCGDPSNTACTDPDTCDRAGQCLVNHAPYGTPCTDDGNECTYDRCDGSGSCTHPYKPAGTSCGDPSDTDCTDPDTCNGAGACLANHEPSGTPCPDGLFCNGPETCNGAGICQPGPPPCQGPNEICNEAEDRCDPAPVTVPDVVGLVQAAAKEVIMSVRLTVGTIGHQYSDTVPADYVISQDPAAGDSVVIGSPVNLVISLGPSGPDSFVHVVDPHLPPSVDQLPGLGGGPVRTVAAVLAPDGGQDNFVVNEVILYAPEPAILNAFMETYGGEVLQGGTLPPPPDNVPPEAVRHEYAESDYYLLRVNLSLADMSDFTVWMEELSFEGEFTFSSADAVRLSAIIAKTRVLHGLNVTPNIILTGDDAQCVLYETEEHPTGGGVFQNGFAFNWVSDDELLVSRAWQYWDLLGLSGTVTLGVVDSGFALSQDFPPAASIPQYDFLDEDYDALQHGTGGSYHGSGVLSTAAAHLDNQFGSVGTGGQVATPMLFKVAGTDGKGSQFTTADGIRTAVYWGADVVNVSRGGECGWWCRNFGCFSGMDSLTNAASKANSAGVVVLAAADNYERDLDSTTWLPCETNNVLCVGAIDRLTKNAVRNTTHGWGSNYGSKVDIWGVGDLIDTTPNPNTAPNLSTFNGTSAATPYVAGIVTLMKAIDPSITLSGAQSVLQNTANTSPDSRVTTGFINAYEAVKAVAAAAGLQPQGDSYEPNDTDATAYGLISPVMSRATIVPGDYDYFNFETTDYMDLDLWVVYQERRIFGNKLYAAFDGTLGYDTAGLFNFDQFQLPPGRHVLSVWGQDSDSINCYRLEMSMAASSIAPDEYDDQSPPGEPRNDTFADPAVISDTVYGSILSTSVSIDDLNHDILTDKDFFTIQLDSAQGPDGDEECCESPGPNTTQGWFNLSIHPAVIRPFDIVVYNDDGTVFESKSSLSYTLECPHNDFSEGKITFSVHDSAGRNFYNLSLSYRRCYTRFYPHWFLEYEPPVFRELIPEFVLDLRWNFPRDPEIQEQYFNGMISEPFPAEYLIFDKETTGHYLLDISFPADGLKELDVTLINEAGEVVTTAAWVNGPTKRLDVPNLPAGMYFLKIEGGAFGTQCVLSSPTVELAVFAAEFGRADCSDDCACDFDHDGDVDGTDLAVFAD